MLRFLQTASLLGILCLAFSPGYASRAELDGRGLPRFLALDPSNIVVFPGSASLFSSQALLDFGVNNNNDRFAMVLVGRKVSFGYALDGLIHNLIVAHRSGWGACFGISDQYHEQERAETVVEEFQSTYYATTDESSRRDLRLTLGWCGKNASGRSYEVSLGGSLINSQESSSTTRTNSIESDFFYSEWNSGPGSQVNLRLRTISPGSGILAAVHLAYEDLHPEVVAGPPDAQSIRRYALSNLGWRFHRNDLDDLVIGMVIEWYYNSFHGLPNATSSSLLIQDTDTHRYFGGLFASGERSIAGALVGRAGVRGTAFFQKDVVFATTAESDYVRTTRSTRSDGAIQPIDFFLGLDWNWKSFALDGRPSETLSLDNPLTQWSVSYSW